MIIGMNLKIYVQIFLNAKRKKRKSKGNFKHHKNILPQIIHIFKTSKLLKNTHYKEIDPYWGVLWRQYEYLRYLEIYLKIIIDKYINNINIQNEKDYLEFENIISEYLYLLSLIKDQLSYMVKLMFNAFFIQIGGVINSRFFGWKKYIEKFIETFYEVAIENISKLRFDINKTRCSVYFYQAFWLSGLTIVNQIKEKLEKEKQIETDYNRGNKLISKDYTLNNFIENTLDYINSKKENINKKIDLITEDIDINSNNDNEILLDIDTLNQLQTEEYYYDDDIKKRDDAIEVIRNIMKKANIPLNIFYNEKNTQKDRIINAVASRIKRKLKHKKITLSDYEIKILRKYLGKNIDL